METRLCDLSPSGLPLGALEDRCVLEGLTLLRCSSSTAVTDSYFGGGHGGLWDQVLVDAGARDGSFAAVGGQGARSGKASREGGACVVLGNLLDDQHFGDHLFATGGIFCSDDDRGSVTGGQETTQTFKNIDLNKNSYPTPQHGERPLAPESQAFQLFQG